MERTIEQLKKMNTERLHRTYEKVTGRTKFNPWQERQEMIEEIIGRLASAVKVVAEAIVVPVEVLVELFRKMVSQAKVNYEKVVQVAMATEIAIARLELVKYFG